MTMSSLEGGSVTGIQSMLWPAAATVTSWPVNLSMCCHCPIVTLTHISAQVLLILLILM